MSAFSPPHYRIRKIEERKFIVERRRFLFFWIVQHDVRDGVSVDTKLVNEAAARTWVEVETRRQERAFDRAAAGRERRVSMPRVSSGY
jgi:hypothetical protein